MRPRSRSRNLMGRVELVGDWRTGLRLKVCPPDLLGALWYQLAIETIQRDNSKCVPFAIR